MTRGETREVNDKVWEKNLYVSAQDKSNVIINMNPQGNPRVQMPTIFDSETHVDGPFDIATWDVSRAHFYR